MMKEVQPRTLWADHPVCTVQTRPWTSNTVRQQTPGGHLHTHNYVMPQMFVSVECLCVDTMYLKTLPIVKLISTVRDLVTET